MEDRDLVKNTLKNAGFQVEEYAEGFKVSLNRKLYAEEVRLLLVNEELDEETFLVIQDGDAVRVEEEDYVDDDSRSYGPQGAPRGRK